MNRGKKYAAIKKGEAGERVTSKDQVTARVAIFEFYCIPMFLRSADCNCAKADFLVQGPN